MAGKRAHNTTREIADHLLASGRPQEAVGLYHHLIDREDAEQSPPRACWTYCGGSPLPTLFVMP